MQEHISEVKNIGLVITDPSKVVSKSMHVTLENGDPVPLLTEKLYDIASIILAKDPTVAKGELLSPREMLMMTYMPLIESCPTGQEEGIVVCYNALTQEIPLLEETADESITVFRERAERFLQNNIQKTMDTTLNSQEFLNKLGVDERDLKHKVHQVKYLRNEIGKDYGIAHEESFDENGGWVSKSLLRQTRTTICAVFFEDLKKEVVKDLKNSFNAYDPKSRRKLYHALSELLTETAHENLEKTWYYSEADPAPILTDFGAILLLEKSGYLHAEMPEYQNYLQLKTSLEELKEKETRAPSDLEPALKRARRIPGNQEEINTLEDLHALNLSIEHTERELALAIFHLENIEMQAPSIPVIRHQLVNSALPSDIQELKDAWDDAESSIQQKNLLISNLRDHTQGNSESQIQILEKEISELDGIAKLYKEQYEKAHRVYNTDAELP